MSKAIPTNIWDNEDLNPITADVIHNHFDELEQKRKEAEQNKGLFKVKTANEWLELAKTSPIPEMLFTFVMVVVA